MTRERRLGFRTLFWATAAALLGGYVYVTEIRGGPSRERAEAARTRLLPVKVDAVTEIRIEKPGAQFLLRKEGANWRMIEPVRSGADEGTITRVLTDLAEAKIDRSIVKHSGDLSAFGLSKPILVTVTAGPQRMVLSLGKANATGEFVYALRDSGDLLMVDRRAASVAEKTLFDLRDKTVLDFGADEVTAVSFNQPVGHVRLVRRVGQQKAGQPTGWDLVEPIRAVADRGKVERALELLGSIRAEQFAAEDQKDLGRFGLAGPWGRARFEFGPNRSDSLLLGNEAKYGALSGFYACRPGGGPVYVINGNLASETKRSAAEWRDKRLADFDRNDVVEMRLITPARTVVCAKREGPNETTWGLAEFNGKVAEGMNLAAAAKMPSATRGDSAKIDELISRLSTLEAVRFIDDLNRRNWDFGVQSSNLKVVALDKSGKQLAWIAFGATVGANRYALSTHLGAPVVLVPASDAARFTVHAEDLAAR